MSDSQPARFTSQCDLIDALRDAAELEHQLMVQYLYAGFSLTRDPYGAATDKRHCTHAQYESVRRWSSTLFMVARQEMEHLSLANGMLTAIGGEPHLARQNITSKALLSPYFTSAALATGAGDAGLRQPRPFPYAFTRFDLSTVQRFVCGESPPLKDVPADRDPYWCFFSAPLAAANEPAIPLGRTHRTLGGAALGARSDREDVEAGTVQELYEKIKETFRSLPELRFTGDGAPEVEVPVEYNVFVFPVTDRTTAIEAVDLILEQGEGLTDPWNLDSHFRRFFEMREEIDAMTTADEHFDPAYALLAYPDPGKISDAFTHKVFDVTNEAYVTLLVILASLYQNAVPAAQDGYPFLSTALSQNAFAPAMTMILRALNEILVLLPVGGSDPAARIGPNFWIEPDDLALLEHPSPDWTTDLDFLLGRWNRMTAAIGKVADEAPKGEVAQALRYVYESAFRTGLNIGQTYSNGLYAKFVKIPGQGAQR